MSALVKAELQVLDTNGKATETVPVQLNPTTMQLQMSNSVDGGTTRGRQTQQYNGSASTQLSLELHFDTAEEGTSGRPVDVRTRTDTVRQFVLPTGKGSKGAPPRVRFRWGPFELTGVMTSLNEDLSLFSREGVPLRAKLGVQIKEQDPKFAALKAGPGANPDRKPPAAGGGGASASPGVVDRVAAALSGESAADFLARNGLAPEAWRALGGALDVLGDGVELQAGASVGFDSHLTAGAGLGVTGGVHVGLGASTGASFGLETGAGTPFGFDASASVDQGLRLSAAGGPTQALEHERTAQATAAAAAARASFGATGGATLSPTASTPTSVAVLPRADRRSTTYGRGVPLRARVEVPGAEAEGYVVLRTGTDGGRP